MTIKVIKRYDNQVIHIPIRTQMPERIVVKARHFKRPYTYYFDTAPIINGVEEIVIKIPDMPEAVVIELYNEKNGNMSFDNSFQIKTIYNYPVKQVLFLEQIKDKTVSSFMVFSNEFSEKAGILSAQNSVYKSPDGKFTIHYKDVIRDDDGKELRTPARINTNTKIIEIAKKYYISYTVAGRKAINLHEFSHLWRNKNSHSEIEADKNAIMVYLGFGNPVIEAYNVFLKVFINSPHEGKDTQVNRYNELKNFINETARRINVALPQSTN